MKNSLLSILIFCIFSSAIAQEINLTEWKKDSIPLEKELNKANHSKDNWYFELKNDTVRIIQNPYKRIKGDKLPFPIDSVKNISGNKYIKSVFNGYLIGFNHGEFGGGLKYVSLYNDYGYHIEFEDKENEWKYGISGRNVRKIFEFNDKIIATRGLAHMGLNYGSLVELIFKDGKWKYKYISRLIESPGVTFQYNEFIYIITSQYILKIDKELKIKEVLKSRFYWGVLYPSSSFIKENDIYIAMRKGILIIKDFESEPKYEWYIKKIL